MNKIKYACGLSVFGNVSDRFVKDGYKEDRSVKELIGLAKKVPQLEAVELVGGWHVNTSNVDEVNEWVKDAGLKVAIVHPDLWTQKKWAFGGLASTNEKTYLEAKQTVKNAIDMAVKTGSNLIDIWFGQDGWEYSMTQDYEKNWDRAVKALIEITDYNPNVRIGIEYKIKEPRTHMHFGNFGKVMMLINEVNKPNLGIILDFGHVLNCYENAGQLVAILRRYGDKLFHIHLNDNYRFWDDDLIPCSVNIIDYIEFLYWLEITGYDGWYSLDIFPYREDGVKAATESLEWIKLIRNIIKSIGIDNIKKVIEKEDPIETLSMIRKHIKI